ncbi:MAG: SAM-dependent methyltransferase [Chlamydiia bacterium]|nr:SAM-dependent methyltransferase [Chlamydiia bacterium]
MTLFLFPNLLATEISGRGFFSQKMIDACGIIDGLIAEGEKEGRRFLKRFSLKRRPHEIPIALLNEHTRSDEIPFLLQPMEKGENWGLISDCGLPCIADPGALLVRQAQEKGIGIQIFPGLSSIFMGLMLSGFSGQVFSFFGYLPKEEQKIVYQLKEMNKREGVKIFIERPYRNVAIFKLCLQTIRPDAELCVATDLTLPSQKVTRHTITKWRELPIPDIHKKPTIFLFSSHSPLIVKTGSNFLRVD